VDFQDISREIAISQGLSVMVAGRKGTSVQIVQINLLVDGRITGEASLEEVVEPRLEVAAVARTTMVKEAGTLGD
jgi:hypothetical protein